jgi:hypothetical protein
MHDSTSTHGLQRPRVRRGLGIVVGAAMLVTPIVAVPTANAGTLSNVTPQSLTALIAQLPAFLVQILTALGNTLAHPLGEQAPNSQGCSSGELVSATLTCNVVGPLQSAIGGPGGKAKAKVTASMKRGKVSKVRWVSK